MKTDFPHLALMAASMAVMPALALAQPAHSDAVSGFTSKTQDRIFHFPLTESAALRSARVLFQRISWPCHIGRAATLR